MPGFQMLDVAIGLIFIYLLLSLVVTAASEVMERWLRRRSQTLGAGITNLLGPALRAKLYKHDLIRGLSRPGSDPSYIPSRTFAMALLDSVDPQALPRALAVLHADAGGDLEKFKKNIEEWFNNAMERVSGWYKRQTQVVLLLLAMAVTVWANADTLAMANTLWRDPAVRAALVAQAQKFAEEAKATPAPAAGTETAAGPPLPPPRMPFEQAEPENRLEKRLEKLESLALPLGWTPADWADPARAVSNHFFGWLLTVLAVSLGAPFWFDMLNKVISIRSAGRNPKEKEEKDAATARK